MKKKWGILFAAIVLAIFSGALWIFGRGEGAIAVKGKLPPQDLAEVKRLVKHELRREILPDWSWASIKHLPERAAWYWHHRITSIELFDFPSPHVNVGIGSSDEQTSTNLVRYYIVDKMMGSWQLTCSIDPPWIGTKALTSRLTQQQLQQRIAVFNAQRKAEEEYLVKQYAEETKKGVVFRHFSPTWLMSDSNNTSLNPENSYLKHVKTGVVTPHFEPVWTMSNSNNTSLKFGADEK